MAAHQLPAWLSLNCKWHKRTGQMKIKQTPKFDLYGILCKRPDRTTRKRQKTPQRSYIDAVRIIELQRLSGDTDTF